MDWPIDSPRNLLYHAGVTAGAALTGFAMDAIIPEADLPMRLTALTPCFRSEAGSAGRDTRGMLRQHQFWKVEMVSITTPEHSTEEHERMTRCAERVLTDLGLTTGGRLERQQGQAQVAPGHLTEHPRRHAGGCQRRAVGHQLGQGNVGQQQAAITQGHHQPGQAAGGSRGSGYGLTHDDFLVGSSKHTDRPDN